MMTFEEKREGSRKRRIKGTPPKKGWSKGVITQRKEEAREGGREGEKETYHQPSSIQSHRHNLTDKGHVKQRSLSLRIPYLETSRRKACLVPCSYQRQERRAVKHFHYPHPTHALMERRTERVRVKDGVAGGTKGEAACVLVKAVVVGSLCREGSEGGREGMGGMRMCGKRSPHQHSRRAGRKGSEKKME